MISGITSTVTNASEMHVVAFKKKAVLRRIVCIIFGHCVADMNYHVHAGHSAQVRHHSCNFCQEGESSLVASLLAKDAWLSTWWCILQETFRALSFDVQAKQHLVRKEEIRRENFSTFVFSYSRRELPLRGGHELSHTCPPLCSRPPPLLQFLPRRREFSCCPARRLDDVSCRETFMALDVHAKPRLVRKGEIMLRVFSFYVFCFVFLPKTRTASCFVLFLSKRIVMRSYLVCCTRTGTHTLISHANESCVR